MLSKFQDRLNNIVDDQNERDTFTGRVDIMFATQQLCSKLEALWVLKGDM